MDTNTFQYTLDELSVTAKKLLAAAGDRKTWLFIGEMGTGKTTLIKELCRQLEITTPMSSPTFSLVNEYASVSGKRVFHFDLYRVKDIHELNGIGLQEYLDSNDFCLIEWPQLIMSHVNNAFVIKLNVKDNQRTISYN